MLCLPKKQVGLVAAVAVVEKYQVLLELRLVVLLIKLVVVLGII